MSVQATVRELAGAITQLARVIAIVHIRERWGLCTECRRMPYTREVQMVPRIQNGMPSFGQHVCRTCEVTPPTDYEAYGEFNVAGSDLTERLWAWATKEIT